MKGRNKMTKQRLITIIANALDLFLNYEGWDIDRLVLELGIKKSEEQELGLNELREIFKEEK
jgi:hypothetical protein